MFTYKLSVVLHSPDHLATVLGTPVGGHTDALLHLHLDPRGPHTPHLILPLEGGLVQQVTQGQPSLDSGHNQVNTMFCVQASAPVAAG